MSGSLNQIVDDEGHFTMAAIDNIEDAHEALHECFEMIRFMGGYDKRIINHHCKALGFPVIAAHMRPSSIEGGPAVRKG